MSQIDSLIRLYTWELDEKRRRLGDAQAFADSLHQELADLEVQVLEEQKFAGDQSGDGGFGYGQFASFVIQKREEFAKRIADAEAAAEVIRQEVAEAYQDLKKFEKTKEIQEAEELLKEQRKEQLFLDELAQNQLRRKAEGG